MKTFKALVLLLATLLVLAACARQPAPDPDPDPDPTQGRLVVNVTDADGDALTATIAVTDADGDPVDSQTASSFTWDVDPGTYTVNVSAAGFQSASQSATIAAGATATLSFQLAAVDPAVTDGTLVVVMSPAGTITVKDADGDVVDTHEGTSRTWTVPAGTYTVSAAAEGFLSQEDAVEVPAGGVGSLSFSLVAEDVAVTLGDVGEVELVRFFDIDGNDYDTVMELNRSADKLHVAAQTEEEVGVTIRVWDVDGDPLANAPVTINLTSNFLGTIAVYPGTPVEVASAGAQPWSLTTDEDGYASFTIEATSAMSDIWKLDNGRRYYVPPDAKFIVSAVGGNNVAKRAEFKTWFVNMSHLWYIDVEDRLVDAETRLGDDVGFFTNIFEANLTNEHTFWTVALQKQPMDGPFFVGGDPRFWYAWEDYYPGYMVYTIDEVGAADVRWYDCPDVSSDGRTCTVGHADYGPVSVAPKPSVKAEDLPIQATITATYYFVVGPYGVNVFNDDLPDGVLEIEGELYYAFALKDYTFTKEWVAGFLEVDKFVDHHVLTWAGPSTTLGASNITVPSAVRPDTVFTTTYTVTITNDSNAPVHGVALRDAVPAELGVFTSTIETSTDGGATWETDVASYNPLTHTITWNYNQDPGLLLVDVGDVVLLRFQVYARHKPGYAWSEGAEFNTDPFGAPHVVRDELPYWDPYCVTNGARSILTNAITVNASGWLDEAQVGTPATQRTWAYTPVDDESTVCVVRPFFEIEKTRLTSEEIAVGMVAQFEIEVSQVDRVNPPGQAYNLANPPAIAFTSHAAPTYSLLDAYPDEFDGTVRSNPYAYDIAVKDQFDVGLDFTDATNFVLANPLTVPAPAANSGTFVGPVNQVEDNDIEWNPISWLLIGNPATSVVTLTAGLPTEDGVVLPLADRDPDDAWFNCAYLTRNQLNQPVAEETSVFFDTIYALGAYTPARWLQDQIDEVLNPRTPLVNPNGTYSSVEGWIEDCDWVRVVEPTAPFLGINVDGEHREWTDTSDPNTLDLRTDIFYVGETFWYVYSLEAGGTEAATDILIDISRSNGVTRFDAPPAVFMSQDGRSTWNAWADGAEYDLNTFSAGQVNVTVDTLEPGEVALFIIPATAMSIGEQTITYQLVDYANNVVQSLPLVSTDSTSVAPGSRPVPPPAP